MKREEKLYEQNVVMSDHVRVYYTMSDNEFGNPLHDRGELAATGSVTFIVSKNKDMSDTFTATFTPNKCPIIEIFEVKEIHRV